MLCQMSTEMLSTPTLLMAKGAHLLIMIQKTLAAVTMSLERQAQNPHGMP